MDLKQLEYFLRVAELGSFTRAAVLLGVAQPALSRQVGALERELGRHLLERNGRGVLPTDAGKLLMEHARGVLHQVQRAREDLRALPNDRQELTTVDLAQLKGKVAIGLPPSLARVITVPLTRRFRQQMPLASLSITEGLTLGLQEALLSGQLDIAMLYGLVRSADLSAQKLHDEELVLVREKTVGKKSQIKLRDVASLPLIIPARPNALRVLLEESLDTLSLTPNIALEVDGIATILDLVSHGLGVAVLPRHAVEDIEQTASIEVCQIVQPRLVTPVSLVTSLRRVVTPLQDACIKLIVASH